MIEHMRSMIKIPDAGSTKSREPRSQIPDKLSSNEPDVQSRAH